MLTAMQSVGAYSAERAAALSGVPLSTVHYWSRHDILVPSVAKTRPKLWSYLDLMALRVIYWLRQTKTTRAGAEIPRTSMRAVRRALTALKGLDLDLFAEDERPRVAVDREGSLHLRTPGGVQTLNGQVVLGDAVDLIAPFHTQEGALGPDLREPRPHLRIMPGKLGGSPHVLRTRVETQSLAALARRGYSVAEVVAMYPFLDDAAVVEAVELERQLERNLAVRPAA